MKCAVCSAPVKGKRLCPECDAEVKERVKQLSEKHPEWYTGRRGIRRCKRDT